MKLHFPTSSWRTLWLALLLAACSSPAPTTTTASAPSTAPAAPRAAASAPARVPGPLADNLIVYFVVTDRFLDGDPFKHYGYHGYYALDYAYGNQRLTVQGGAVSIAAAAPAVLLERADR